MNECLCVDVWAMRCGLTSAGNQFVNLLCVSQITDLQKPCKIEKTQRTLKLKQVKHSHIYIVALQLITMSSAQETAGVTTAAAAAPTATAPETPTAHEQPFSAQHGLNKDQVERYSRHLLLPSFGVAGQGRLCNSKALIVGCGGLGSPAAMYLAAAGVGTLGLVDHDVVELSNMHR